MGVCTSSSSAGGSYGDYASAIPTKHNTMGGGGRFPSVRGLASVQPGAPRPVSRSPSPNPILLDTETHMIKTLTSSQFEIMEIPGASLMAYGGMRSSSRSAIIPKDMTGGALPNRRPVSTRLRFEKPVSVSYRELVFKQALGQGTYGEVFRGYWKGRKVAVKRIFPGQTTQERIETLADFDRELEILSKLRHPRIVQFLGYVNEQDEPLCFLFELCEGSASLLLKMVKRHQVHLTWRLCLSILRDTAEAVHYLHTQTPKVIHRDLKAENILLDSNFRCKLTDFGLSRMFDARRPLKMTVCGTPCWVAPEVFRNDPYDEKADSYSFGVLVWEILAARKPYSEKDCAELPILVGQKGLRPGLLQTVPQEVNELMTACWEEHPHRRPDFATIRRWLDHITYAVEFNRKMTHPVHVMTYGSTHWDFPPVAFEFKPMAPPLHSKRISAHRTRRADDLFENNENARYRTNSPAYDCDTIAMS